MKLMVSVLLLVAICHAGVFGRRNEEEERTAKRELQEGNFGLKLQPSLFGNSLQSNPRADYGEDKNVREQGTPQKEFGAQKLPVAKISDVLTGQGPSFPAAIQSHLFSPVQIYEPRLGSPTTFEISQPVPSQLAYTEHKIYQATQNIQTLNDNLQSLNQNLQASQALTLPEQSPIQSPLPGSRELQPPKESRSSVLNDFLPRFEASRQLSRPDFPDTIYRQVFSQQAGVIPQDIYQQINQLGNQINYEDTIQLSEESDKEEQRNNQPNDSINTEKQQQKQAEVKNVSQLQDEGQQINEVGRALHSQFSAELSTQIQQPQAVSYASFSQSLPTSSQILNNDQKQTPSFSQPLLQLQQLPHSQQPPLFQPLQSTQAQSAFQSLGTTPSPQPTLFTVANQTPRRIGIVRIRQEATTPLTVTTVEPEASSSSTIISADDSPTSTLPQSLSTKSTLPPSLEPRSTLTPLSTLAQRTTLQSNTKFENTIPSRPTLPPLPPLPRRLQTNLQSYSTSPVTTLPLITQTQPTFPPQPVIQTFTPATLQPQFVQPTLTPLSVLQPQQLQPISTQPQLLPTLQPIFVSQAQPLPQLDIPGIRAIPVQRQQFQIQPEIKDTKSDNNNNNNSQQQLLQQHQLQFVPEPQQIQQQLQSIQQQLQFIQQQPQFIQQQPQPVKIIQQQTQPFPQSVQLLHQQPLPQPQPVQLIQSRPQLIQEQPQLIQSLPTEIIQPQPIPQQNIQLSEPNKFIQSQAQPIQENSQLVQPQPNQLAQLQPKPQQQDEPAPKPQAEVQQNFLQIQQEKTSNKQAGQSQKKQEIESSEESDEEDYPQLLHNSEEFYIQPPHLHPVPVAFSSFHGSPNLHPSPFHVSPFHTSPLHAPTLHTAPLHSSPLHVSPLHASPFYSQSVHGTFPSVQYFGKYSAGIFKGWR